MVWHLRDRWREAVAQVLIAMTIAVAFGPALHPDLGHDRDCDPIVVVHDAAQHQFTAVPRDAEQLPADEHCVVCHQFRVSRELQSAHSLGVDDPVARGHHLPADNRVALSPAGPTLPARAPPVLS